MKDREIEWLLKEKYGGEKSEAFFADCKRLALGEPLAYLIGWAPFLDCKIRLGSRPLVPRPETEYWTAEAIKTMRENTTLALGFSEPRPLRVLDLCAGSGCIGIAVAKAVPTAQVDFAELDEHHLPTIKINITGNDVDSARTKVIHSNLFSALPERYDYILSNPPYIDETLDRTDESVKKFEPYVALFGGEAGMDVITEIIEQAPQHLSPGGQLWLEHEPEQTGLIHTLGTTHGFSVSVHKDQYGVERYSILVLQ